MERRVVLLASATFVAAAILGGALFYDGGTLSGVVGGQSHLVVRVDLTGHDASTRVEVTTEHGVPVFSAERDQDGGTSVLHEVDEPVSGRLIVKLHVSWTDAARRSAGTSNQVVDADACGPGEQVLVVMRVDTSGGVAFPDGERVACV